MSTKRAHASARLIIDDLHQMICKLSVRVNTLEMKAMNAPDTNIFASATDKRLNALERDVRVLIAHQQHDRRAINTLLGSQHTRSMEGLCTLSNDEIIEKIRRIINN